MDILLIDMNKSEVAREAVPEKYERLGGRSLTGQIIADEVDPLCHALGAKNRLVVATGLLAGTTAPCSGRISIGTKSPLTGGIKESNVGGSFGNYMTRAGIKAIVVKGMPEDGGMFNLVIEEDGVKIEDASDMAGLGTYDLVEKLHEQYGSDIACLCIGPAGEQKLSGAAIMSTDVDGRPSRAAGRGGTGAVMGAKGIKAIICKKMSGKKTEYVDSESFRNIAKEFSQKLIAEKAGLTQFGTAAMVKAANLVGGMPTRNYSSGSFELADQMDGMALHEMIEKRGGEISRPCHSGCVIKCSNVVVDEKGDYITSSLEYETMVMNGPNLGIGDLDALAKIDRAMDDAGLDTIETGAAIGVAMESGLLEWGDAEGVLKLVDEVKQGSITGKLIASGAAVTGKVLGARRVPHVKGQSMVAYDPRTFKGMGCAYATSPMGADHTAGPAIPGRIGLDPGKSFDLTSSEGQLELSRDLQIMITVCDSLGYCFFVGPDIENMKRSADLLNKKFGWDMKYEDVLDIGVKTLQLERQFNKAAGIPPEADMLPEFVYEEELPPSGRKFDISAEDLRSLDYSIA